MNIQFCFLISSDFSCSLNSFTLCVKTPRYAVGAGLAHTPFSVSGNDMLTFARHLSSSSCNRDPVVEVYCSRDGASTKRCVTNLVNSATQNTERVHRSLPGREIDSPASRLPRTRHAFGAAPRRRLTKFHMGPSPLIRNRQVVSAVSRAPTLPRAFHPVWTRLPARRTQPPDEGPCPHQTVNGGCVP